jgi:coenzyme PQQ precursor peptide PqqA
VTSFFSLNWRGSTTLASFSDLIRERIQADRLTKSTPVVQTKDGFQISEESMAWKAPKIVEVAVGLEINMYACASLKK